MRRELKEAHGLKQQQVISNLNYLIDRGWVKEHRVEKAVTPRGGTTTIPSVTSFYAITSTGIDRIEGGSEFERIEPYGDINVTAAGANVITLGDGNIVNAEFHDLRMELDELKHQIVESGLSDEQKLDAAVDIETIKDQLAKPSPDPVVTTHAVDEGREGGAARGLGGVRRGTSAI